MQTAKLGGLPCKSREAALVEKYPSLRLANCYPASLMLVDEDTHKIARSQYACCMEALAERLHTSMSEKCYMSFCY